MSGGGGALYALLISPTGLKGTAEGGGRVAGRMKGRVGQLWQRTCFSAEPPSRNGSYIKFMSGWDTE